MEDNLKLTGFRHENVVVATLHKSVERAAEVDIVSFLLGRCLRLPPVYPAKAYINQISRQMLMQLLNQTVLFTHYCKRLHVEKRVFTGKNRQI